MLYLEKSDKIKIEFLSLRQIQTHLSKEDKYEI